MWPLYLRELGAEPQDIGIVFGAGNLVALFCFLPAGYIADRVGRKPVLAASFSAAALGVWSFVALTDWHGAFVGSALYWSGTAALPVMFALVASTVSRERLGAAMGLVLGAYFAGNIAGSPLSGFIASQIGLRATVAAAAVLLTLSAGTTFLIRGTPPSAKRGAFRPPRTYWMLLAVTPLGALVSIVGLALLPVYLHDIAHVPLERIGIYTGLVSVGATILAVLMGRLADSVGAIASLLGAAGIVTAAAVLMAFAGRTEEIVAVAALFLGATQAANPVLAAAVERILPSARAAFGYATYQVAFAFGIAIGGALSGFLYEADPLLPFLVTAAMALPVAATVAAVLSRTTGGVARELS